jgi:prolyl oligopeptidase
MRSTPESRSALRILAIALILCGGCRTPERTVTWSRPAVEHAVYHPGADSVAAPALPHDEAAIGMPAAAARSRLAYPTARRADQVDDWHGTKVEDPYRWLEDADSPETRAWIDAENAVTQTYLESIPRRDALRARLTELWNYERYGLPYREAGRYVLSKNDGLQNQNVLYVADKVDATPRVLIDPNTFSKDGTVALAGTSISKDGKLLAYGVADAGSDWVTWRVRNLETGQDEPDKVEWVKFSGAAWTKLGGFFYSRFDAPKTGEKLTGSNRFHKLYFHPLGMEQTHDRLVYERKEDGELNVSGLVTDDDRWLLVNVRRGTQRKNYIGIAELPGDISLEEAQGTGIYPPIGQPDVRDLIAGFDASYAFVGNQGSTFWFRTDKDAPRGRIIALDAKSPDRAGWKTVVPESPDTLLSATHVGGRLILSYLKDARSVVKVYETDGRFVRDVKLPGLGTASGFDGEADNPETFYTFTSFMNPGTVYRYDVATGGSTVFRKPEVRFDLDRYETTQVFYPSKDGTKVPMFLTHQKGMKPDGNAPVLLYAYGGFNVPITPSFSVTNLVWMEMGGVYAVANLRGGSEYGEDWHAAGMKDKKQNVFDDFIAAAEWLIGNRWTRRERLATFGGSNGGLLVGATMIQRPDLFAACMPAVGVMDMLRFHKFTVGWGWVPEYGTPDDPKDFKSLHAYSPYHNLRRGEYPATLITTSDHDDRVVPAHSFKFAAALQHAQTGAAPALIRIEVRAGHGAGKPTKKQIEEAADRLAFLTKELGM